MPVPVEIAKRVPWKFLAGELWRNREEVLEAIGRLRPGSRKDASAPGGTDSEYDERLDELASSVESAFKEVADHLELLDRVASAQRRRTSWVLAVALVACILAIIAIVW